MYGSVGGAASFDTLRMHRSTRSPWLYRVSDFPATTREQVAGPGQARVQGRLCACKHDDKGDALEILSGKPRQYTETWSPERGRAAGAREARGYAVALRMTDCEVGMRMARAAAIARMVQ